MLYFNIFILIPILLALFFHIPNISYIWFKRHKLNQENKRLIKTMVLIYSIGISLVFIIALLDGFYTGLGEVKAAYYGFLYLMYFITFIFIYSIQFLILKLTNNSLLSSKSFKILIYSFALIISVFTYGFSPMIDFDILKSHLKIWNNTLTSLIIFDVLFYLLFSKPNEKRQ
ncbi:hypothetical protein HMPREF9281_00193 [Staphylococcus epidermidis BVS058A4]|nr:hypothetical protein HMPREF9281_00193 [Staphylococcus epidermidis BVS058A4]